MGEQGGGQEHILTGQNGKHRHQEMPRKNAIETQHPRKP